MPTSLQPNANQGYITRQAAETAQRELMISTLGSTNPINKNQSNKARQIAESLAKPFPTTRPTRSASTPSLSRRPAAPLTRVPSTPTLPTPSTNKGVLGKTVNGLGTATKATGNALVGATKATGQFVGNVAGKTVGAISKLKFWGGKTRRNRRAHKKTRSRRYL